MKKKVLATAVGIVLVMVFAVLPVSAQSGQPGMMQGQSTYEHMTGNPWIGQCLMGHGLMGPGMMGPGMGNYGYGSGPGMMGPGMGNYGYGSGPGMMQGGTRGQQYMQEYDEETMERMREFQRNMPGFDSESREKMRELQRTQSQLMLALTDEEVDVKKARELYEKNLKIWNELALRRFDQAIKYLQENQ